MESKKQKNFFHFWWGVLFALYSCTSEVHVTYSDNKALQIANVILSEGTLEQQSVVTSQIKLTPFIQKSIFLKIVDSKGSSTFAPKASWQVLSGPAEITPSNNGYSININTSSIGDGEIKLVLDSKSYIYEYTVGTLELSLSKIYPLNPNWNDFVLNTNASKDEFHQTDSPCIGNEIGGPNKCIHGALSRKITISQISSCDSITAEDSLQAFNWICREENGGIVIYLREFKPTTGLSSLLNSTSWKLNSVIVKKSNIEIVTTPSTVWWENTIVALPDNLTAGSVALDNGGDSMGRIYTYDADKSSNGYNIIEDRVAIVSLNNAKLKYAGDPTNNTSATGEIGTNTIALISAGTQKFIWIEGHFIGADSGTNASKGVYLYWVNHSNLRKVTAEDFAGNGVQLDYKSSHNLLEYTMAQRNGSAGIRFDDNTHENHLFHTVVSNNTGLGFHTLWWSVNLKVVDLKMANNKGTCCANARGAYFSVWANIVTVNNRADGLDLDYTDYSKVIGVLAANNQNFGFDAYDSCTGALAVLNYTSMNHASHGMRMRCIWESQFTNIAVLNNGGDGIFYEWGGSQDSSFHNLSSTGNAGYGINLDSENVAHTGNLIVGNNGLDDCNLNGAITNKGIEDINCTLSGTNGSSDYSWVGSSAEMQSGVDISSSFSGLVSSDNTNGTPGVSTLAQTLYDNITDFLNFDNVFRFWGLEGTFAAGDNRGPCYLSGQNCRVWDASLASSDNLLLRRVKKGSVQEEVFQENQTCPASVHGDISNTKDFEREIMSDGVGDEDYFCDAGDACHPPETYLLNAQEIFFDYVGDEDGLCESGEACVYSPNIGAYQGHGGLTTNTCNFQNGNVVDVKMYANKINGF